MSQLMYGIDQRIDHSVEDDQQNSVNIGGIHCPNAFQVFWIFASYQNNVAP